LILFILEQQKGRKEGMREGGYEEGREKKEKTEWREGVKDGGR